MIRIYIAYATADRAIAEKLKELLCERGIEVWPDERELAPGDSFQDSFEDWVQAAIRRSDRVFVLWSANSMQSHHVRQEAMLAKASGKLLPVRLGASPPPVEFADVSTFDLGTWSGEHNDPRIQSLLDSLVPDVRASRDMAVEVDRYGAFPNTGVPTPTRSSPSQSRRESTCFFWLSGPRPAPRPPVCWAARSTVSASCGPPGARAKARPIRRRPPTSEPRHRERRRRWRHRSPSGSAPRRHASACVVSASPRHSWPTSTRRARPREKNCRHWVSPTTESSWT